MRITRHLLLALCLLVLSVSTVVLAGAAAVQQSLHSGPHAAYLWALSGAALPFVGAGVIAYCSARESIDIKNAIGKDSEDIDEC